MSRPQIFLITPENLEKALEDIKKLGHVLPVVASTEEADKAAGSVASSVLSGNEELYVVVNGQGIVVAGFSTFLSKNSVMLVRFIRANDAPVWVGYVMRAIFEMALSVGAKSIKFAVDPRV